MPSRLYLVFQLVLCVVQATSPSRELVKSPLTLVRSISVRVKAGETKDRHGRPVQRWPFRFET
jgi:hypothetical protein